MACRSIERLNLEGFLYSVLPCHSALACMLHCVHALPRLLELRAAALATGLAPAAHTQAVVEAAAAIVGGLARAAPSLPAGGAAAHGAGALVVAGAQMEEWRLGRSLLSPVVLSFMCDRLEAVRKTSKLDFNCGRAPASLLPSRCSVCPLVPQLLIQLQDAEAHRRLPPCSHHTGLLSLIYHTDGIMLRCTSGCSNLPLLTVALSFLATTHPCTPRPSPGPPLQLLTRLEDAAGPSGVSLRSFAGLPKRMQSELLEVLHLMESLVVLETADVSRNEIQTLVSHLVRSREGGVFCERRGWGWVEATGRKGAS